MRETAEASGKQARGQASPEEAHVTTQETAWWNLLPEEAFSTAETTMWQSPDASIDVEIFLPESKRGQREMFSDLAGYFASQMKRRAVEVNEKKLTPAERELFKEAKAKKIKNFLAANAFEAIPPEQRPTRAQAIGMGDGSLPGRSRMTAALRPRPGLS